MKNRDNLRVYGDLQSEVYLAEVGTTLPDDSLEIPSGFEAIGWIEEEGVPLNREVNVEKFKAWQGGATLRVKITEDEKNFTFSALEEKPMVTELYFGHGAPVVSGVGAAAVATMDLPEASGIVERAAVIRYVDDGVTKLICCENVQISPDGEVPHRTDEGTSYGFNAEIVGAAKIITNNPAYTENDEG